MIKKNFLIKLTLFFITLILSYFLISKTINDDKFSFIKKYIPNDLKKNIKKIFFAHKIIEQKDKELYELALKLDNAQDFIKETGSHYHSEMLVKKNLDDLEFNLNKTSSIKLFNEDYNLDFYKNNYQINVGIWQSFPGSAYIEFYNNSMYVISPTGIFGYLNDVKGEKLNFKQIPNNINEFINEKQFAKKSYYSIKDLKINNDIVLVSFTDEIREDCFATSLLISKLNFDRLNFSRAFVSKNECADVHDTIHDYNGLSSGGRIEFLNDKRIFLTHGDYGQRKLSQDKNSIFGKIIEINPNTNNFSFLSMGHRNQQGLYLDKKNNLLISTEHGPQGGDEINIIDLKVEIKDQNYHNFGWPISSYGEHYGGPNGRNKERYKDFPLYKSHVDYGYIEPLTYFVPSIAISQITKFKENSYVVSALKSKTIHTFDLDKDKKISNLKEIKVGERIRDIAVLNDKLYLYLEDSSSIGIISKVK